MTEQDYIELREQVSFVRNRLERLVSAKRNEPFTERECYFTDLIYTDTEVHGTCTVGFEEYTAEYEITLPELLLSDNSFDELINAIYQQHKDKRQADQAKCLEEEEKREREMYAALHAKYGHRQQIGNE